MVALGTPSTSAAKQWTMGGLGWKKSGCSSAGRVGFRAGQAGCRKDDVLDKGPLGQAHAADGHKVTLLQEQVLHHLQPRLLNQCPGSAASAAQGARSVPGANMGW